MVKIGFTNYWFDEPKYEAHGAAYNTVSAIVNDQIGKYENMKRYAMLWKDARIDGFEPGTYKESAFNEYDPPVTYNVVRSCVDALTSKITAQKPTPRFLTSGGTEELQEKAKRQEKFVEAVIYNEKGYKKAVRAFKEACISGDGLVKVFPLDDRVAIEFVHPSRIVVDNNAALDRPPTTMWQKTYMDKITLAEMYPKSISEIEVAKTKSVGVMGNLTRDLVEVWEVWKLGTKKTPGRHMIFTENTTFYDEIWLPKKFPFCHIRYAEDLMGWYGTGLAAQLEGIQEEINTLLNKIKANFDYLSVPYILKEKSSDVSDEQLLSNEDARLIEYVGPTPPQVITPPAAHPQIFEHLNTLYNKAFEIAGISKLSASSQKPSGLDSGVALRTFHDIETERFSSLARSWEHFFVDLAHRIVDCARELVSQEEGFEVKYIDNNTFEKVNFLDCDLDDEAYVIQVYPASSLPKSPSGRLQTVIELLQGGMIDPAEGRQLLDFPDLEKSARLATAARDDLEATFEHMMGSGKYIEPLPYQDLAMGIKLGVSYYLRAKIDGVPQKKIDNILMWLSEAADMLQPPAPPAPPMAPLPAPTVEGEEIPFSPSAGAPAPAPATQELEQK